jgi:hypothetical protein
MCTRKSVSFDATDDGLLLIRDAARDTSRNVGISFVMIGSVCRFRPCHQPCPRAPLPRRLPGSRASLRFSELRRSAPCVRHRCEPLAEEPSSSALVRSNTQGRRSILTATFFVGNVSSTSGRASSAIVGLVGRLAGVRVRGLEIRRRLQRHQPAALLVPEAGAVDRGELLPRRLEDRADAVHRSPCPLGRCVLRTPRATRTSIATGDASEIADVGPITFAPR